MRSALPGALLLAAAVLFQLRGLGAVRGAVRASPGGAPPPWWEGYARDGINLAAAALAFAGLVVSGYGGPAGVARLLERLAPAATALAPPTAQKSSTLPASIDVCFTDVRGSVA